MNKKKDVQLTERDRNVLLMTYNYDCCGYEHLRKRLFPDIVQHKFYERIRKLKKAGFLTNDRPPAISGIGAGKYLLQPDRRGRREVADMMGCSVSQLRDPRNITRAIPADHQHGICDFRVDLENSVTQHGIVLSIWINERELRGKNRDRVPDAVFALRVGQAVQGFRLEIDRGTITDAKRMVERLKAYLDGDACPLGCP